MNDESDYQKFEVELSSVPGMFEQYSGSVTVWATSREAAIEQAFLKLQRGAFPDRDRSMWRVLKVTVIALALALVGCTKSKPEPAPDIHYFYTVCLDQLYADLPNDGNKEQAEEANRQFEKCLKTAGIRK